MEGLFLLSIYDREGSLTISLEDALDEAVHSVRPVHRSTRIRAPLQYSLRA